MPEILSSLVGFYVATKYIRICNCLWRLKICHNTLLKIFEPVTWIWTSNRPICDLPHALPSHHSLCIFFRICCILDAFAYGHFSHVAEERLNLKIPLNNHTCKDDRTFYASTLYDLSSKIAQFPDCRKQCNSRTKNKNKSANWSNKWVHYLFSPPYTPSHNYFAPTVRYESAEIWNNHSFIMTIYCSLHAFTLTATWTD